MWPMKTTSKKRIIKENAQRKEKKRKNSAFA